MLYWPLDLPQVPEARNYEHKFPDVALRTPTATGPAKLRPRFTRGSDRYTWATRLTPGQRDSLERFWRYDTGSGELSFLIPSPYDGDYVEVLFEEQPPVEPLGAELWTQIKLRTV